MSTLNNQSVYSFDGYNAQIGDKTATLGVNCGMSTGRNGVLTSAAFCPEESAKTRGIGYQEENAPSLRAGVVPATVYAVDQGAGKSTCGVDQDRTPTLATTHGGAPAVVQVLNDQGGGVMGVSEDVSGTLRAQEHGHQPVIAYPQGVDLYNQALTGTVAMPLTSAASDPHHIPSVIDFYEAYQHHGWRNSEIAGVLTRDQNNGVRGDTPLVVDTFGLGSFGTYNNECGTLRASGGDLGGGSENLVASRTPSVVRRLTPKECERLQGYPDEWTNIGAWTDTKGKLHKETTDTARYKALGNSIALPFWFWLLRRISAQYERPATLGSLFDGIGGFPLCWERCNGKGTAIWASEIEDFPIAVTKYHFPE